MVTRRGVPYIDGGAVVSGFPAGYLAMLLRNVRASAEFRGLHPVAQAELSSTIDAIDLAAKVWRSRLPTSAAGSSETPSAEVGASSPYEVLSAEQVAAMLGVTDRRARQLGAGGLGRKVAGQWVFDRDEVELLLAERERCA